MITKFYTLAVFLPLLLLFCTYAYLFGRFENWLVSLPTVLRDFFWLFGALRA